MEGTENRELEVVIRNDRGENDGKVVRKRIGVHGTVLMKHLVHEYSVRVRTYILI